MQEAARQLACMARRLNRPPLILAVGILIELLVFAPIESDSSAAEACSRGAFAGALFLPGIPWLPQAMRVDCSV